MSKSSSGAKWRFLALFALVALLVSAVDSAHADPAGMFGHGRGWRREWTAAFKACFPRYGRTLAKTRPADSGEFCSAKRIYASDFWLSIFVPLAGKESRFNPSVRGRNGHRVPGGLFQMDSIDMARHNCEGRNPYEPNQAICCAIKIADNQAKRSMNWERRPASVRNQIADSSGIMGGFWQPLRSGWGGNGRGGRVYNTVNLNSIKSTSRAICRRYELQAPPQIPSPLSPAAPAPVANQ